MEDLVPKKQNILLIILYIDKVLKWYNWLSQRYYLNYFYLFQLFLTQHWKILNNTFGSHIFLFYSTALDEAMQYLFFFSILDVIPVFPNTYPKNTL